MFDLEKLAFDAAFQLMSADLDQRLKTSGASFLEQRKIESRVESAAVDFAGGLASFLEKQGIPAEEQQRLIETCARELKPLSENPQEAAGAADGQEIFDRLYQDQGLPEGIDEQFRNVYTFIFSRFATVILKISAAFSDWGRGDWAGDDRRFDLDLKTLFAQTNKSSKPPQRGMDQSALENIAFEVPDFSEEGQAAGEDVSFTAMYPREIGVEVWNTLLVYAHLSSALEIVKKDSERFKDQLNASKDVTVPSSTPLVRGTEITIVPQCDGVAFNPQRITLAWLEDFHRADFRFRADKSLADDAARGHIDIYVGPLIVGTLKLALLVSETAPQNAQSAAPQEEHGTIYHQDDIFISYSHKDTDIVLAFKKAYEAIGDNVLIDIDTLRSGQEWNAELLKMIERAEIFQLFWSENTSQSKYCRQEWEYALKLNKTGGFIRPCYWQQPMPAPPAELQHLHFEYVQT